MRMERFDIAIIGAGPAGASALFHLGKGVSVVLFDREDKRDEKAKGKLCGGLLTREAQAQLGEIPEWVRVEPFKTELEYHDLNLNRFFAFPVPYANCDRRLLDKWLVERALGGKEGEALYLPNFSVRKLEDANGSFRIVGYQVRDREEKAFQARFLIDASGWRQLARRTLRLALAPTLNGMQMEFSVAEERWRNYVAMFDSRRTPFYAWWIPKAQARQSNGDETDHQSAFGEVGSAFPSRLKGNANELLSGFTSHLRSRGIKLGEVIGTRGCPLTRIEKFSDIWLGVGALLVAGEAGGLVSPSSGDGISYALSSGKACAEAVNFAVRGRLDDAKIIRENKLVWLYRTLISKELRELRLNLIKARLLSTPGGRLILGDLFRLIHPTRIRRI